MGSLAARCLSALLPLVGVAPLPPPPALVDCAALQALIDSTYDFKPSALSKEQRKAKAKAMDTVWETVEADSDALLPCLRAALEAPDADNWFGFDGSALLVKLDPSPASKTLQVRCVTAVSLEDVACQQWISILSDRAFEGHDVSAAAEKWLADPAARYTIPAHGMHEYKAEDGAFFLLGSMDEAQATPTLVRLASDLGQPNRDVVVRILVNQATPEALRALETLDTEGLSDSARRSVEALRGLPVLERPSPTPTASREELVAALQGLADGTGDVSDLVDVIEARSGDAIAVLTDADLPLLRKARRRIATMGNFHAIEHYNAFTSILWAKVWSADRAR